MPSNTPSRGELRRFWERQSTRFGDFRKALSTDYYRKDEERIIRRVLPERKNALVMKLDLWNEVKNTNILAWVAGQGYRTVAMDISYSLVRSAQSAFHSCSLTPRFSVAALYDLPFRTDCVDVLYTMGTIEHVPDMQRCVREIYRVMKPGGTAIIGVPNKHDPFLRPALVWFMNLFDRYPYGLEQSLTRRELASLLRNEGFEIIGDDGILFMPGLFRMAELALLGRSRILATAMGALHVPFRLLARLFPRLSRHGYLIACIGRKPLA